MTSASEICDILMQKWWANAEEGQDWTGNLSNCTVPQGPIMPWPTQLPCKLVIFLTIIVIWWISMPIFAVHQLHGLYILLTVKNGKSGPLLFARGPMVRPVSSKMETGQSFSKVSDSGSFRHVFYHLSFRFIWISVHSGSSFVANLAMSDGCNYRNHQDIYQRNEAQKPEVRN